MDLDNGKDESVAYGLRLSPAYWKCDIKTRILINIRLYIELYGEVPLKEEETDKSKDEIESAMDAGESKWQFEVCDTITNTGPIIGTDVGQRASNVSVLGLVATFYDKRHRL